jgi:hypothetical protein
LPERVKIAVQTPAPGRAPIRDFPAQNGPKFRGWSLLRRSARIDIVSLCYLSKGVQ